MKVTKASKTEWALVMVFIITAGIFFYLSNETPEDAAFRYLNTHNPDAMELSTE